jgi:hypothetical protein
MDNQSLAGMLNVPQMQQETVEKIARENELANPNAYLLQLIRDKENSISFLEKQATEHSAKIEKEVQTLNMMHLSIVAEKASLAALTTNRNEHGKFYVNFATIPNAMPNDGRIK